MPDLTEPERRLGEAFLLADWWICVPGILVSMTLIPAQDGLGSDDPR